MDSEICAIITNNGKSGDKDAVALFAKYKVPMPDQIDLTSKDVNDIVGYIKGEVKLSIRTARAPFAIPTQTHPAYTLISFAEHKGFLIAILISIALLIETLLFFAKVKKYERTKVW